MQLILSSQSPVHSPEMPCCGDCTAAFRFATVLLCVSFMPVLHCVTSRCMHCATSPVCAVSDAMTLLACLPAFLLVKPLVFLTHLVSPSLPPIFLQPPVSPPCRTNWRLLQNLPPAASLCTTCSTMYVPGSQSPALHSLLSLPVH